MLSCIGLATTTGYCLYCNYVADVPMFDENQRGCVVVWEGTTRRHDKNGALNTYVQQ
jgi:hypothetical protein